MAEEPQYIAGEVKPIALSTELDISGASALTVEIRRPDGVLVDAPPDPDKGAADITIDGRLYQAGLYAVYNTRSGDIPADLPGLYRFKLTVDWPDGRRLIAARRSLLVGD